MIGRGDDGHISEPPTQQPHEARAVRQTRVNSQQGQRDVLGGQRENVDLPERSVPGETTAEHGLDVAAHFEGGLGGGRRRGEDVVGEVEASVDEPRVTAARLWNELLGETSVRNIGRVGRLQGLSGRR